MKRPPLEACRLACVLALACALAQAHAGSPAAAPAARFSHIFVIVLENHSRDGVVGSPSMPRLTALARAHGVARNYYGVTHPSQPNYIAMIGGDTFGVTHDGPVRLSADTKNLVDQLEPNHTWAAYMESIDAPGSLKTSYPSGQPLYAAKHNPFVAFADIRDNPARLARIRPYSEFAADMKSGRIAEFIYIVPNQCHDMHGGITVAIGPDDGSPCQYAAKPDDANDRALKAKADEFVDRTVSLIMHSSAWTEGESAIFIVADESDFDGVNPVTGGWADATGCCDSPSYPKGSAAVGVRWPGGTYGGGIAAAIVVTTHGGKPASDVPYNHYSLLTTIEDNWNLGHLGHAGDAAGGVVPMTDLLGH
jgi:hypothetical protein